jgi:hypothetical protein
MSVESRGGMTSTGELLIRPTEHQFYQKSHLALTQKEHGEGNAEFYLRSISFTLVRFFTYRKILRHGADGFTSLSKEVVLRTLNALKTPSFSANLGSNGKHDNHDATENDLSRYNEGLLYLKSRLVCGETEQ